jgi:hypothetical protein
MTLSKGNAAIMATIFKSGSMSLLAPESQVLLLLKSVPSHIQNILDKVPLDFSHSDILFTVPMIAKE